MATGFYRNFQRVSTCPTEVIGSLRAFTQCPAGVFRNFQRIVCYQQFHSAIQPFVFWLEFYSSYCLFLNDRYIISSSENVSRVKPYSYARFSARAVGLIKPTVLIIILKHFFGAFYGISVLIKRYANPFAHTHSICILPMSICL